MVVYEQVPGGIGWVWWPQPDGSLWRRIETIDLLERFEPEELDSIAPSVLQ